MAAGTNKKYKTGLSNTHLDRTIAVWTKNTNEENSIVFGNFCQNGSKKLPFITTYAQNPESSDAFPERPGSGERIYNKYTQQVHTKSIHSMYKNM